MLDTWERSAARPQSASEFVAVFDKAARCMDQMLGYSGRDRFVIFYYEPRGEEVIWRDSQSYGFATGAWSTFMGEVAPVADHYGADVGCKGSPGKHVLLIDRAERRAYFAERGQALTFLVESGRPLRGPGSSRCRTAAVPFAMVEITREAITQLAHEIWERKGRPQGQELQDWLEAEARLKTDPASSL
jgi:hypothetical protein